ncbi:unnamed protein product [Polarella glacialis]|uniref:Uncharacterized protein n=1 Tax=Polarella glacialis TaxID=89957 RepID=A0A813JDI7_POLGL|nr:unnamed protein product [Polarella glacialis]
MAWPSWRSGEVLLLQSAATPLKFRVLIEWRGGTQFAFAVPEQPYSRLWLSHAKVPSFETVGGIYTGGREATWQVHLVPKACSRGRCVAVISQRGNGRRSVLIPQLSVGTGTEDLQSDLDLKVFLQVLDVTSDEVADSKVTMPTPSHCPFEAEEHMHWHVSVADEGRGGTLLPSGGHPTSLLEEASLLQFCEDGYLLVPQVVPKEVLDTAKAFISSQLAGLLNDAAATAGVSIVGKRLDPLEIDLGKDEMQVPPGNDDEKTQRGSDPAGPSAPKGRRGALFFRSNLFSASAWQLTALVRCAPVWRLVEQLLGQGQVDQSSLNAQVALRFPCIHDDLVATGTAVWKSVTGRDWHTDGLRQNKKHSFSLLLGIALSDIPSEDLGNLCVWPGSHRFCHARMRHPDGQIWRLTSEAGESPTGELGGKPPVGQEAPPGGQGLGQEGGWWPGDGPLPDLGPPVQLRMRAGDVVLTHSEMAHCGGPHLGPDMRYMVYFRIRHKDWAEMREAAVLVGDMWVDLKGVHALREEIDRDMLYSNLEEDEVKIADNTQGLIKNPAGRQFSETTVRPTSSTSLVRGQSRDQLGRGQSRERLGLGQSLDRLGFSGAQTVGKEAPLDSARRGRGDSSDSIGLGAPFQSSWRLVLFKPRQAGLQKITRRFVKAQFNYFDSTRVADSICNSALPPPEAWAQGGEPYSPLVLIVLALSHGRGSLLMKRGSDELREAWSAVPEELRGLLTAQGFGKDCPEVWVSAFVDEADLHSFAEQLQQALTVPLDKGVLISCLIDLNLASGNVATCLQKRRARTLPSEQCLQVWRSDEAALASTEARQYAKVEVPKVGPVGQISWKSRGAKAQVLAERPDQRAAAEEVERQRWNLQVCQIVIRSDLPVLKVAATSLDPDRALANCTGRARSKTLRKKVRTWLVIENWLKATFGLEWPTLASQMVDYIEDRATEPCGRTVPATAISALRYFEKVGEVECPMADSALLLSTVSRLEVQLATNSAPTKKAPLYFLSLLVSMELFVACVDFPLYYRAFAWYKLVKVWASLRSDDCMGLQPCHLKSIAGGIEFLLERTKTSGPGRRVRWLKGYVSSKASITGNGWLATGLIIWQGEGFAFDRDYFLPEPNVDFSGCRAKPSDWSSTPARSRALFRELRQVKFDGSTWDWDGVLPLVLHSQALLFWTDHSERNVLTSVAAFLNVSKADRDFLGRCSPDGSDDYLRTSRQMVHKVQELVAQGIRDSFVPGGLDLEDSLGDNGLYEYLLSKGLNEGTARECVKGFTVQRSNPPSDDDGFGPGLWEPMLGEVRSKVDLELEENLVSKVEETARTEAANSLAPLYFVSFTRKRKFARLHLISACPLVPGVSVAAFEYLCTVDELPWNDFCKKCWPRGFDASDGATDEIMARAGLVPECKESSSSSGSSSLLHCAREETLPARLRHVVCEFGDVGNLLCRKIFCLSPVSSFFVRAMPLQVLTAEEKSAALASASSDIRFHFDELQVNQDVQVAIYHGGFTSLRLFAALDEDATKLRECLRADFGLDPTTDLPTRRQVALVVAAWESGRAQVASEDHAKQEARSNHFPRPVGVTEHAAMRAAVESKLGTLRNYEVPSKPLIGQKLEQVEQNELRLEDFREVTSIDDGEVEYLAAAFDSGGALKVRRGSAGGSLPDGPEELRLRHKRIALAWAFVATKHCNRPWLRGGGPGGAGAQTYSAGGATFLIDVYRKLSDHVLGKEVAGLTVTASDSTVLLRPSWVQVLHYDSEVRKHAYESIRSGVQVTIMEAIEASCKDVRILQLHLLNPLTLEGNARAKGSKRLFDRDGGQGEEASSSHRPIKPSRAVRQGPWPKGLGKGKGDGQKGKRGKGKLFSEIPRTGKAICFAFGKKECEGGCEMEHVCQQCLGNHPLCECPNKPKPRADTGGKGNPKVGEARKQPLRFLSQSPGKSQFSPKVAAEFSPSPPALSGLSAEGSALVSASSSAFSAGLFHLPAGARTGKSPVVSAATEQHPSLAAGVSSSSSVGLHDGKTFRTLYLFSGTKRKADVGWFLRVLCKLHKVTLLLQEFDLCNGEDLSMEEDWAKVLGLIESKGFDLVFSTPPCNDFSRARWANKRGPQPSRNKLHPWGYPWLKGWPKRKAELANLLFKRSVKACHAAHLAGARFLKEHPEDLGRVASGEPASTWQLPCTRQLAEDSDADTVALHQCRWPKVEKRKPTRLMGTVSNLRSMGHAGWPSFNKQGFYLGPLPRHCGHSHNTLIGRDLAGNFHTAPTAAYPPPMCSALADLFMQDFLLHTVVVRSAVTFTPTGGEQVQESVGKKQVPLKSAEEAESDLDEDGFTKPRFGSGLWGQGPPLSYVESGKLKHFSDGCGLCSPGRWEPERRQVVGSTLADEVRTGLLKVLHEKLNVKKVIYQLACNQFTASPFEEALLLEGIATLVSLLEKHGAAGASAEVPPGQPARLPALENFLQLCGDPDFRVFHSSSRSFSKGVTLGILGKLPRVPAVFDKKEHWRKYPEEGGEPGDGDNYVSARDNLDSIKKQFEEERALGAMREVLEVDARREYGSNLLIAPIGAIEKADASFRVIRDGTHKVQVNPRIRARDQHKCPGTGELKTVMRSSMKACKSVFGLTGDVKRARRLPRVWQAEWGLQACKLSGDTVWLNEVGTFGMGPAAYHWARESGGMGRACLYLMQNRWFYELLYADDFNWISSGAFAVDDIVLAIFFLCILGVPMSWKKFHGGLQYEWVGYWSDLRHRRLGISEARADWLVRWMSKALVAGSVCIEEFKSVLGRMGFAMRALETFRPFLGPLYAWSSAVPMRTFLPLPVMIRLILLYLKDRLKEGSRTAPCGCSQGLTKEHFRADAKAEGEDVRIGGWECLDSDDVGTARWFSEVITRENAPWVFEAGDPFRTIATLELLATLCCLVAFLRVPGPVNVEEPRALLTLGGSTDNLGNKFVVAKLQTTKYPLVCVLMEIAAMLHQAGEGLDLQWVPRLQNIKADQLTNGDFRGFDPALRVRVNIATQPWVVLNSMLKQGRALYSVIREGRIESSKRKLEKFAGPFVRSQKKSFRERDPWQ